MSNDYSEKLRSTKWQKLRLEKMQSCDWKCQVCGDADEELNVHHKQYKNGHEPWQYKLEELECLCRTCHQLCHLDAWKINNYNDKFWCKTKYIYVKKIEGDSFFSDISFLLSLLISRLHTHTGYGYIGGDKILDSIEDEFIKLKSDYYSDLKELKRKYKDKLDDVYRVSDRQVKLFRETMPEVSLEDDYCKSARNEARLRLSGKYKVS